MFLLGSTNKAPAEAGYGDIRVTAQAKSFARTAGAVTMSSTGATWANIAKKAGGSNPPSNPVSSASSEQGGKSAIIQSDAAQSKVAKSVTRPEKELATPSRLSQGSIHSDEASRDEKSARLNDNIHP